MSRKILSSKYVSLQFNHENNNVQKHLVTNMVSKSTTSKIESNSTVYNGKLVLFLQHKNKYVLQTKHIPTTPRI